MQLIFQKMNQSCLNKQGSTAQESDVFGRKKLFTNDFRRNNPPSVGFRQIKRT